MGKDLRYVDPAGTEHKINYTEVAIDDSRADLTMRTWSQAKINQEVTNAKKLEEATGNLSVAKGGTGANTSKAAQFNLLNDMQTETSDVIDDTSIVCAYNQPTAGSGMIFKRSAVRLWNYIKSKIESLALTFSGNTTFNGTVSGTGIDNKLSIYEPTYSLGTGDNANWFLLGYTHSSQNNQSFTELEIQAGRIDGWLGCGRLYLVLGGDWSGYVYGIRDIDMSNINIVVTHKDGQSRVYALLSSYCKLLIKPSKVANFVTDVRMVSSPEGDVIWNNAWEEKATRSYLANTLLGYSTFANEDAPSIDKIGRSAVYKMQSVDYRFSNESPSWYCTNVSKGIFSEFKATNSLGIFGHGEWCQLVTYIPWSDTSGGFPIQMVYCNDGVILTRKGTSDTDWGQWLQLATTDGTVENAKNADYSIIASGTDRVTLSGRGDRKTIFARNKSIQFSIEVGGDINEVHPVYLNASVVSVGGDPIHDYEYRIVGYTDVYEGTYHPMTYFYPTEPTGWISGDAWKTKSGLSLLTGYDNPPPGSFVDIQDPGRPNPAFNQEKVREYSILHHPIGMFYRVNGYIDPIVEIRLK